MVLWSSLLPCLNVETLLATTMLITQQLVNKNNNSNINKRISLKYIFLRFWVWRESKLECTFVKWNRRSSKYFQQVCHLRRLLQNCNDTFLWKKIVYLQIKREWDFICLQSIWMMRGYSGQNMKFFGFICWKINKALSSNNINCPFLQTLNIMW